jgi:hypothetical protein
VTSYFFARHSGESRNPVTFGALERSKSLDPGFRRDDKKKQVLA